MLEGKYGMQSGDDGDDEEDEDDRVVYRGG